MRKFVSPGAVQLKPQPLEQQSLPLPQSALLRHPIIQAPAVPGATLGQVPVDPFLTDTATPSSHNQWMYIVNKLS